MTVHELLQDRLHVDPSTIEAFCRKWGIRELSLFGSALRDDFRDDSDVDVLVAFEDPDRSFGPWLSELQTMENELAGMFGRRVDLALRDSVERSANYIRRRAILSNVVPLYVA